jgi:hypothetical protein
VFGTFSHPDIIPWNIEIARVQEECAKACRKIQIRENYPMAIIEDQKTSDGMFR